MDQVDIKIGMAAAHRRQGRGAEAAAVYQSILRDHPEQIDALLGLAELYMLAGAPDRAAPLIETARKDNPLEKQQYLKVGRALIAMKRYGEAIEALRNQQLRTPRDPEAMTALGSAYLLSWKLAKAEALFRQTCARHADYAPAFEGHGIALLRLQRPGEALQALDRAIALKPTLYEATVYRCVALLRFDRVADAARALAPAVAGAPLQPLTQAAMGALYRAQGQLERAAIHYGQAVTLDPDNPTILNGFALTLRRLGQVGGALAMTEKAVGLAPQFVEGQLALGALLAEFGDYRDSQVALRQATAIAPHFWEAHSHLLSVMTTDPGTSPQEILQESRKWDAAHAVPLTPSASIFESRRDSDRPLRVGYVSADFRRHPTGFMAVPAIERHDRAAVETFLYSVWAGPIGDEIGQRLKSRSLTWVDAAALDEEALAARIRADRIDILVDLSGHSQGSRLRCFARRPAPIQVSWQGGWYGSTGLSAIDYLMTDRISAPEGEEAFATEKLLRLPRCRIAYAPPEDAPEVASAPAARNGFVTFASFNRTRKFHPALLSRWAELLKSVPGSQLLLKAPQLGDPLLQRRFFDRFAEFGVEPKRLTLSGPGSQREIMEAYSEVDIALDPLPYNGGLVTCEALWMGVPVVTCLGDRPVARQSATILHAAGLDELIAPDPVGYLALAAQLAGDLPRLQALRGGLRDRLRGSVLLDSEGLARDLERAYRAIWKRWCAGEAPTAIEL